MIKKVRTRFASSPSGYLHLGGARTAIFNYVYAKQNDGEFVLRIDDTDDKRNISDAFKPIIDGLLWLGLDWDIGPIFQSGRQQLYLEKMYQLIKSGFAYPCYETEIGKNEVLRGSLRNQSTIITMSTIVQEKVAIRFRMPDDQPIVLEDEIRGKIEWKTKDIGDPIIFRRDGTPTYNFATVVDDLDLNITHIIRGEEHLNNTPIQMAIYYAMQEIPPKFAHLPLVCEPSSNTKLSKRRGHKLITIEQENKLKDLGVYEDNIKYNPATISYYKELGYPPEAVVNYLSRLGWALDGKTEIFSKEELIENFKLEKVRKSPASFDPKKFYWTSQEYLDKIEKEDLADQCIPYLQRAGVLPEEINIDTFDKLVKVINMCGSRIKIFSDIVSYGDFFFRDPIYYHNDSLKSYAMPMADALVEYYEILKNTNAWGRTNLEKDFKDFISLKEIVNTNLINALRVAISGKTLGPSVFECMEILSKAETLRRIEKCLAIVNPVK